MHEPDLMSRLYLKVMRLARPLLAVVAIVGLALLFIPQPLLTIDSGEAKGDVLIVLGGGSTERPDRGAELFKAGVAPKILVSGSGDCDRNAQWMEARGVPANAITIEGQSLTTFENAKFAAPLLRQMGARRVVLVTSWYHSRRALACFQHFSPGIQFYSRPSYVGSPYGEWISQSTLGYVRSEYVKLIGYWLYHGVSPFPVTR
jgi:uncharacterized SAM-binding protein YcdF (DUF218 family)